MSAISPVKYMSRDHTKMVDDLAQSGLTPEDLVVTPGPFKDGDWRNLGSVAILPGNEPKSERTVNTAAYVEHRYAIAYYSYDGSDVLARMQAVRHFFKTDAPKVVKKKKYFRPSEKMAGDNCHIPYAHPKRFINAKAVGFDLCYDIHEGEKKAAKGIKHGQFAVGIPGCGNWGDPARPGDIHPWIALDIQFLIEQYPDHRIKVRIWPDADFRTNLHVQTQYSALAVALMRFDVDVVIMDLTPIREGAKFDDLAAEIGYEALMAGVETVPIEELRESPPSLCKRYALIPTIAVRNGEGTIVGAQAIAANFKKLLAAYPTFKDDDGLPLVWLNRDDGKLMYGTESWVDGVHNHDMLCYFQDHLGFNGQRTAAKGPLEDAISAAALKNARSPFEDRVRVAATRLTELGESAQKGAMDRLDTWVIDYLHAPDTPFNRRWGRKLLVSLVGRAFNPGCALRVAFCICGPQKIGKTFFMQIFVPDGAMSIIDAEATQGKDQNMVYASCLIAVQDEMGTIGKRELPHVKSDISRRVDKFRPPYGHAMVDYPRRCITFIPVDKMGFLPSDPAGMNRFAVLNLLGEDDKGFGKFDFKGLSEVADDLLGAAYLAMVGGEVFEDIEGADEVARSHQIPDATAEQITSRFCGGKVIVNTGKYKSEQIAAVRLESVLIALGSPDLKGGALTPVTEAMRGLGFTHCGESKEPLGLRYVWTMPLIDFNKKFPGCALLPIK